MKLFYSFKGSQTLLLLRLVLIIAVMLSGTYAIAQTNIVTQHGDLFRTGLNNKEKLLTVSNVNSNSFGKAFSVAVDDQIYAQPLVVSNLTINSAIHNVVYVATVNNTVYAIDGDNGALYWSKNYTPSGQRPPTNKDMTGACGGNYNDFSNNMGIVGTPVIDTLTKTMYFVTRQTNGTTYSQLFHAIDITTGSEKSGSPVNITATSNGYGDGNVNGVITFDAQKQNQRCGLALSNGIVYIAYAAHCDWGPYHGWILGFDASTLARKIVYNTTPEGYNGGIWMSAGAPAIDETGNLYVSVGNGSIGYGSNISDVRNRSESAIKLTPTATSLSVSTFFTPLNYQALEDADLDFGVTQLMLIPNTTLALTGCKDGNIYLMNRDNMGGYNSSANNVVQTIALGSNKTLRSSLSYYKGPSKEFFYTWSENAALKAFPFNRSTGKFEESGVITGSAQGPTGANGTLLSVSSNGTQAGTGILWASHASNGNANQSTRPGILRAFDANDVTKELWNSSQNTNDNIGNYAKFVCPTIANGKVYMATFSNQLIVYGGNGNQGSCSGSTNLALNKPATSSSDENTTNVKANAFDGTTTTRWASATGADPQWIYTDLGTTFDVCRVTLRWEVALAKDFQIQVSNDASTWTTVKTITGNTSDFNDIILTGTGRYVRMYGTARGTAYGYSLYEMEVYGSAVNTCAAPTTLTTASVTRTGATLQWEAVTGATSYKVQYKTVPASTYTSVTVSTNSLSLTTLECGTDYLFNVQTVCSATSSSAVSASKGFSTLVCDASCGFLPTRWATQDVGSVGITGSACFATGIFTLNGAGSDIGGTADGFRFAYKTFTGNGTVTARIDNLDAVNASNKAGVMFRETLDGTSRNAFMALTSGSGANFQYRLATSGNTSTTNLANIKAPYYVKVVKRGTSYAGYVSIDSVVWKRVGSPVDLGFGGSEIYAGIVVSSHDNTKLSQATFSKVPIVFSADTTVNTGTASDGLKGEYYNTIDLSGSIALTRTDASVNFDWGNNSYATGQSADNFSARWTGQVLPKYTETYTFETESDDGVRLWVNGVLLIDKFVPQSSLKWTGTINLIAGTKYDIKMEYYEGAVYALAKLRWSSTSQPYEIIPQSQLYSTTSTSEAVTGVSIAPTTATLTVGGTQQLTPTVSPSNATNKNVTYSSSSASVATVNASGLVTAVAAGTATITLTTADGGKTATTAVTVNASSAGDGLKAEYYNTQDLSGAIAVTRTDASINFDWGTDSYATGQPVDNISTRWTGQVLPKYSETYTFETETDDGVRLWVNNVLLIDKFVPQSTLKWTGTISLTAGTKYNIKMEYYEGAVTAVARLRWSSASQAYEIIPQSQLYSSSPATVAVTGVSASPTTASLVVGGTQQLTATVAPANATNKNVTWSSSASAVATVNSSGLVTAVAAGSATITVTTQDGTKTATSSITVTTGTVAVTGVSVSPTSASIAVNATQQLTATVAPSNATNKNVSWSSSNTTIATVSSTGLVTGKAAGTATITVTSQDGSNKTATSAITVTSGDTWGPSTRYEAENGFNSCLTVASSIGGYSGTGYVTNLNTNCSETKFDKGVNSVTQTRMDIRYANGTGSNVTNLALYIGSNQKIQDLVFPSTGSFSTWGTITVTFNHDPSWGSNIIMKSSTNVSTSVDIDYSDVSVSTVSRLATQESLEETGTLKNVSAYPNPAKDLLNVTFYSENENDASVELITTLSQVVSRKSQRSVKGSNLITLDVKGLEVGLYVLHVSSGSQKALKKIIIVK